MIIAKNWVWLHLPKCGGTSMEAIFRNNFAWDRDVVFDKKNPKNVIWHHNITARERYDPSFKLGDRDVLCCFRRLPEWLLSRVHYEAGRLPHRTITREMFEKGAFFENSGNVNSAEDYAIFFSTPRVDHWLRLETMHQDLSEYFGRPLKGRNIRKNKTTLKYIKDVSFWFTKNQLEDLYGQSPTWAKIEKEVYGDLLV